MGTPERATPAPPSEQKQIDTPKSRVEDSPVFNYINNLSPIKPVKSLHITQSFQSLTFPPVPSVFSSPHLNVQKVSKFFLRPHTICPLKFTNGDKDQQCTGASHFPTILENTSVETNYIRTCHLSNEATDLPVSEHATDDSALSLSLQYNCSSPNHNIVPFYDAKQEPKLDDGSPLLIDNVSGGLEENEGFSKYDQESESIQKSQQDSGVLDCEWKAMISDNAKNLLELYSSNEVEVYHGQTEIPERVGNPPLQMPMISDESMLVTENSQAEDSLEDLSKEAGEQNVTGSSFQTEDLKQTSNGIEIGGKHQRGMLRRCLVFEISEANRRNANNDQMEAASSSISQAYDDKEMNLKKAVPCRSPCLLPGIGLHLNSLASSPKDRLIKRDVPYDESSVTTQTSVLPFPSFLINEKLPQVPSSTDEHQCTDSENLGLHVMHETSLEPEIVKIEELNSSSPKKKRRKIENNNENGACRRCNCKKSKCLKLYCECFAAGVYCVEPCTCKDCFNKPLHEDTVLATRKQIESRNPLAFAPKVIRTSELSLEIREETNKTPASARHKRGCNCKKSNCLKKYCECFQGSVGCSFSCRCEGCKNTFGTKYGKLPMSDQVFEHAAENVTEHVDGSIDSSIKDGGKWDNPQSTVSQIDDQQKPEAMLPITPSFPTLGSSGKPPCPLTGKRRSTVLVIGSTPHLNMFKALGKSEMTSCEFTSNQDLHAASSDETPDILRTDTPSIGIKVSSPNRKRVSPPHHRTSSSTHYKGSRKLILKSIPSFPSLLSEMKDNPTDLAVSDLSNPSVKDPGLL